MNFVLLSDQISAQSREKVNARLRATWRVKQLSYLPLALVNRSWPIYVGSGEGAQTVRVKLQ